MNTFLFRSSTVSPGSPITRLMKSRSGSSGYLNTTISPRRRLRTGRRARPIASGVGPNTNLFTRRWSPMSRLFSIDPVGILNACTTHVRTKRARITAMTIDSKYSRMTDFLNGCVAICDGGSQDPPYECADGSPERAALLLPYFQHRQERLLRDLDAPDALHALLAFLLLLEQLALARDVAAVALRKHVLPQRLHGFARDDPAPDRRLDRHL